MRHPGHRHHDNPWGEATAAEIEIGIGVALILETLNRMENTMATKEQLDKLTTDVAALIDAGVAEITAAIMAAQKASPDPAIDTLDARVTAATKGLTDAAAALANPPA
jgi:hypothetical protein